MDERPVREATWSRIQDFLIEIDFTEEQRARAQRLKREADKKQLAYTLEDHVRFFGRRASVILPPPLQGDSVQRSSVLAWFASLDVARRMAVMTCDDPRWVRTALRMAGLRGASHEQRNRFRLESNVTQASSRPRRLASRAPGASSAGDPLVRCRQPHRLPDGELLAPLATPKQHAASTCLEDRLRAVFGDLSAPGGGWSALAASSALVADVTQFAELMDQVSLGWFLRADIVAPARDGPAPWSEASWLGRYGSHFTLAAFLGSRLEVLLLQGFAARGAGAPRRLAGAQSHLWHLSESLANMGAEARGPCLERLRRDLTHRFLMETSDRRMRGSSRPCGARLVDGPPRALAALQMDISEVVPPLLASMPRMSPFEIAEETATVSLALAARAPSGLDADTASGLPGLCLQQQLFTELAALCSEHNARALVQHDASMVLTPAKASRRREKKLRQRLRRMQDAEGPELQHEQVSTAVIKHQDCPSDINDDACVHEASGQAEAANEESARAYHEDIVASLPELVDTQKTHYFGAQRGQGSEMAMACEAGAGASTAESARSRVAAAHQHECSDARSDNDDSFERQYRCEECGDAAEMGAIDEADGFWYCVACWEVFLAQRGEVLEKELV